MDAGDVFGERFEIDCRIAAGGMGAIYRARDRVTGAPIALKVMLSDDRTSEERFFREAGMLAELAHHALVSYVAHGETPRPWLAMEWLEGEDLAARLTRGPLTIEDAVIVARRVASALAVLHRKGLVHRDVKPSNIFLVGGAVASAKLLDLGVARAIDEVAPLTRTGFAIGTPFYMAPEQARSAPDLDGRADVFGLGCVIFECLRGQPPFPGRDVVEVLAKIILAPAPALDVSPALDALVDRMLAKDPSARPADGDACDAALATVGRSAEERRPAAREGVGVREQRVVTLILTGRADPLAHTIDRATADPLAALRSAAAQAGARVEALANGSVLIALTEPSIALDQCRRAAEVALRIRKDSPGLALSIATGRAEVRDAAPIGEAVARAARGLDHGRIRIDAAAAALLGNRFEIAHDAVGAYLCGARGDGLAARRLLGRPTEFVGRARELSVLEGLYRESVDEPRARVALVSGAAGAGKSRLRDELLLRFGGARLLVGMAEVSRAGTPFGLLGHAIRGSARVDDGASPEEHRALLRARVQETLSGDALERALPFIGEIAGVPFEDERIEALRAARSDPMLMADAIRGAFEAWIGTETSSRPVAFVLDDAHWGDASSMRVLDSMLRALADRPVFVLLFARPEVHATFPALFRDRDVQEVRLSAIGKRACEQLAREALGDGAAETTIAWIVSRAGGNAFFLEELIRAAAHGAVEVPDTVLGVVQARLDALGPAAKRLLRAASVFGETFWRAGVEAVMDAPVASVMLDGLVAAEVIGPALRTRFAADEGYAFRHALLRDAAYAMLTDEDRATAHRRAAEWLECRGAKDPVELAEHHRRAGDPSRAARFFADAAEAALEGNDLAGADARAEQGAECGAAGTLLGRLRLVQTIAAMWRGAHADALRLSQSAMALLEDGSAAWFRAVAELMAAAGRTGEHAALDLGSERLLTVGAADDAIDDQIIALSRAMIPLSNAVHRHTDAVLDRAVAIAAPATALGPMARAQLQEARALRRLIQHDFASGMGLLEDAVRAYERAGAVRDRSLTLGSLAWAHYRAGFDEEALAIADEACALATAHGLDQPRWWGTFMRGSALCRLGRHLEAVTVIVECIEVYRRQGNARHEGWARTIHAEALFALGRWEEAERGAALAAEVLAANPIFLVTALSIGARACLASGRTAEARPLLARAEECAKKLASVGPPDSHVFLAAIELARAEGDPGLADALAERASREIVERVASLAPEARHRYLRIPEHALLLGMAAAAGGR